jgi:MFS family permease
MFAVGYGANQFVPLLAAYRSDLRLSDASATAVFGVYALGLIPGFLVGGPASDRHGRRRITLAFTAVSLVASAVLMTGRWGEAGLFAGRLLTGVASGTVFTVGTAWTKELSGPLAGVAARRAALALTAGFGIGPLVAGILARWAPEPLLLPYLVHIALGAVALVLLLPAPETRPPRGPSAAKPPFWPAAARSPRFRRVVLPMAPWVFGSVTVDFTTLPAHGVHAPAALGVAFPGLLAAAALCAGLLGQRWGRRLGDRGGGRHPAAAPAVGLAVVVLGYVCAAVATGRPGLLAVTVAAAVLGTGYGVCLVVGLREVEQLAAPEELGTLVALYYSLAYLGLAVPFLLALAAPGTGYPGALLLIALVAGGSLALLWVRGRRPIG